MVSKGTMRLVTIVAAVTAVWLWILPALSELPSVQRRVQRYRDAGVNVSAFFYSDHPAMRDIERSIDSVVNGADTTFWEWPKLKR